MSALRTGIALCAVALGACDNLLGLNDITPDGAPTTLTITAATTGVSRLPLGLIVVSVQDIVGRQAVDFNGEIKLALGNNPSGATLMGTFTATAAAGTARFDVVGIDRPGVGYTLVASADGLPPVTSSPIDVTAPRFTPVSTGLTGGSMSGIAVSPGQLDVSSSVFVGAADGVYRSFDAGASWESASFGGLAAGIPVADSSRSGVLYLRSLYSSELKKTVDGGVTWHNVADMYVSAFAIDPNNPSVLYALSGETFRRSTDGGASWTELGAVNCNMIAADLVAANTVYCGATYESSTRPAGLYKSSDGGATWRAANTGLTPPLQINMLTATPNGVYVNAGGALYRSLDAAGSWTQVSTTFTTAMAHAPSRPSRVYLAQSGVAVSNDGGITIGTPVNVGAFVQNVAVDPTNPDVVYATGPTGVFVSTNGGVSWSPASRGLDARPVDSVAIAPRAPSIVFATIGGVVRRTINGGTSWMTLAQTGVNVLFDPAVSTRAYQCGGFYFAVSNDSGATFTGGAVPGLTRSCSRLLTAGSTYFVAGGGRFFKSTDSGASWADTGFANTDSVNDVAIGDVAGTVVVATTPKGVFRSTNGGASFGQQVITDFANKIVADPTLPTRIILGDCGGFRISTDGGTSFGARSADPCIGQMTSAGSALYATSNDTNKTVLLSSTDGGSTWVSVDVSGIPNPVNISSIAASADGQTVYIATQSGLYRGAAR